MGWIDYLEPIYKPEKAILLLYMLPRESVVRMERGKKIFPYLHFFFSIIKNSYITYIRATISMVQLKHPLFKEKKPRLYCAEIQIIKHKLHNEISDHKETRMRNFASTKGLSGKGNKNNLHKTTSHSVSKKNDKLLYSFNY